jgi:hypothetical protein
MVNCLGRKIRYLMEQIMDPPSSKARWTWRIPSLNMTPVIQIMLDGASEWKCCCWGRGRADDDAGKSRIEGKRDILDV